MSGTLTQAPKHSMSHRAAAAAPTSSDHLIHIPRAPRWTTPNILRTAAAAVGAAALIAAVVTAGAASDARSRITAVAGTDAPSVRATEDFLFQLQDMDAQLLNALLANGDATVHVPQANSESLYERDRRAADGDLEAATTALAGDKDALDQLHSVADVFGQYQAQAVRTLADDEGQTEAGKAPGIVVADYLAAHEILFGGDDKGGLMRTALGLEQSSAAAIDDSASSAQDSLSSVRLGFILFGVLLLGGVVALQLFLSARFQRMVSPALAAAAVAALVFMIGGASAAAGAAKDFHSAKSDAFDSVLALGRAKALSSGANADESRWLLVHDQPGQQARFEASFLAASQGVAGEPATDLAGYESLIHAEAAAVDEQGLFAETLDRASGFGREFRNITYPSEGVLAVNAFDDYDRYLQDDARLRTLPLATPQDLKAAVDFDTNADTPGTSDQAFTAYAKDLDAVIDLNQAQFDKLMPAARDRIGSCTWLPYPLAVLVIGLTALGVRTRLNEFR
ncbi:hypothetical protein [Catenulispora subtropica]|uniref:Secreted protein n=1 Tax=Catenulispora subtropica TaxID=450798 RepID=A0ABN2QZ27_9ACTN